MLTDADHVWHAMYFKHPNERARYIKSQIPHADTDHLLRKYNKFPKIYRDDLVEFAVIVNGKVVATVPKRQEAHDLAKQHEGYVIVADVPKSESNNPKYDRYYQEIIKTPLVPHEEVEEKDEESIQEEQPFIEKVETIPEVVDNNRQEVEVVEETTKPEQQQTVEEKEEHVVEVIEVEEAHQPLVEKIKEPMEVEEPVKVIEAHQPLVEEIEKSVDDEQVEAEKE